MDRKEIMLNATKELAKVIRPGDTVYILQKYKSRTSIDRSIAVLVIHEGKIKNVSALVSEALNAKWDGEHEGVVTHDSYNLLFNLSTTLHGTMGAGSFSYSEGKAPDPTSYCYAPGKSFKSEYI